MDRGGVFGGVRSNRIDTIDRGEDLVESDPTELTQLTQLTGGRFGGGLGPLWYPHGTPVFKYGQ